FLGSFFLESSFLGSGLKSSFLGSGLVPSSFILSSSFPFIFLLTGGGAVSFFGAGLVAVSPQPKENKPPMSNPASSFFTVSPSFQNLGQEYTIRRFICRRPNSKMQRSL